MKQIFKNGYVKSFSFTSIQEVEVFLHNQETKNILVLNETYGDYQYCYVWYDSLTGQKQFIVSFSSDDKEDNLNLLVWDRTEILVVDTGKNLYLINKKLNIKACFDITTPLIGLCLTSGNNLLVLEEAAFRLVNSEGKILNSELFDLIENFAIDRDQLSIHTSTDHKIYKLV